jgi:glycosyltransferase involved in cell wall biosynthesis
MTAAGWAPFPRSAEQGLAGRANIRKKLGIPPGATVFGIAGSLAWTKRCGYCYGWELVQALSRCQRHDICALVVGDGSGRRHLERLAGDRLDQSVFLPGFIPQQDLPDYLAAMDVASLPQSVDQVGSFRYTTKLSEYLAAGLPVVTGQIPLAYDLEDDWLWRLPGNAPWDDVYINALADLMTRITSTEFQARRAAVPKNPPEFDRSRQIRRVTAFLTDLLKETSRS